MPTQVAPALNHAFRLSYSGVTPPDGIISVQGHGALIEETKAGNEVYIGEIGKIKVKRSAERQGRNPATGETLTIKAKNNPVFKPSIAYKQILNK